MYLFEKDYFCSRSRFKISYPCYSCYEVCKLNNVTGKYLINDHYKVEQVVALSVVNFFVRKVSSVLSKNE